AVVGNGLGLRRTCPPERRGGLAVDRQLRRDLLDRQLGRLRALENPVHEEGGVAVELRWILPVAHQSAGLHEVASGKDRWQTVPQGEPGKLLPSAQKIAVVDHDQSLCAPAGELRERIRDALRIARIGRYH